MRTSVTGGARPTAAPAEIADRTQAPSGQRRRPADPSAEALNPDHPLNDKRDPRTAHRHTHRRRGRPTPLRPAPSSYASERETEPLSRGNPRLRASLSSRNAADAGAVPADGPPGAKLPLAAYGPNARATASDHSIRVVRLSVSTGQAFLQTVQKGSTDFSLLGGVQIMAERNPRQRQQPAVNLRRTLAGQGCWRRRKGAHIRRTALVSRICRVGANLL